MIKSNEFPEFRIKVILNSILVVSASLALTSLSSNMTVGLMHGIINTHRLVLNLLKESLLYGLIPGIIIGSLINLYLKPFHETTVKLFNKENVEEKDITKSVNIVSKLNLVIIALNLVGYLTRFIVMLFSEPFTADKVVIKLLYYVSAAVLFSIIQTNIVNIIISKAKSLLKVYKIDSGSKKIGLQKKNVIIIGFLTIFISITLIDAGQMIHHTDLHYEHVISGVLSGEITIDEARTKYQKEASDMLQVEPETIPFPYDLTEDQEANTIIIYIIYFIQLLIISMVYQYTSSRFQKKQIKDLQDKMNDISVGNGDLTKQVEIFEFNEMGELTATINSFLNGLRILLKDVKLLSTNVKSSGEVIKSVLISTEQSTHDIVAANEQTVKSTKEQIKIAHDTTNNIKDMLSSVKEISDNIETQASFVEQTSSAINQMAANIESVNQTTNTANQLSNNLVTVANKGGTAVDQSVIAVKRVEEFSNEIIQMVTVITDISDKTNLLAMNAAIEAAHAGESGKGFAVVAQEVRKLAEDSSTSAKQISDHIKKMVSLVNDGVELSEGAGKALNIVGVDVKHTSQLIEEVAAAMDEQSAGTREVLDATTSLMNSTLSIREITAKQQEKNVVMNSSIEELTSSFKQIEIATHSQSDGTKDIQNSVRNLKKVILDNEKATDNLENLLEGFIL